MKVLRLDGVPAPLADLAFSVIFVLLGFVFLSNFEQPKKETGLVTPKAEFMITMDWTDGSRDDVDLYVKGPDDRVVFFKAKYTPLMFLDTDNTGNNTRVSLPTGESIEALSRREIVTLRGFMPGTYTVNIHAYAKRESAPTPVTVTIIKINPYAVLTATRETLVEEGQELTIANFTVNDDGTVKRVFHAPERFVREANQEQARGLVPNQGEER